MTKAEHIETPSLNSALRYARRGWSVIPIRPGEKRPLIAWEAYQHRRAEAHEIRGWFRYWRKANIGIVTGAISGLVVLDIDAGHGGMDSLTALERQHGPLPETVAATTGGGGRHLYFRHPGGIVRNKVGLARGIDLRGDGGLIVAPPSLHPSGRHYVWAAGRDPDSIDPAPLPSWLNRSLTEDQDRRGHPVAYWRSLLKRGVDEGERNNTIAALAGHLLWHGVDVDVCTELLLCWNAVRCRPPLSDDEVVRTVGSIAHLHERRSAERDGW